jgi:hypothetical protein
MIITNMHRGVNEFKKGYQPRNNLVKDENGDLLLVPDPGLFEVEIAISKLKNYKLPGSDEILAELIQVGGETLLSATHKLIHSIWNREEVPDQWKESAVIPVYKKSDKTDSRNSNGTSLLSTSYKILFTILLTRLIQHKDEIIEDNHCRF